MDPHEVMQARSLEGIVAERAPSLWRWLAETRTVHILCAAPDGTVVACNDAVAFSLKTDRSRILGQPLWERLSASDADRVKSRIASGGRQPDEALLLNFVDADGLTILLRCRLDVQPDGLLLLGEMCPKVERMLRGEVEQPTELRREPAREPKHPVAALLRVYEAERCRVARSLHDTISQGLAALVMNLEVSGRSTSERGARLGEAILESRALAERCGHQLRALSLELHPPQLGAAGLASAIAGFCRGLSEAGGIEVDFAFAPNLRRLPDEVERTFYVALREGLANVRRHSGSRTAHVRLFERNDEVVLEVLDEGRGMPAGAGELVRDDAAGPGAGLAWVRECLEAVGARLELESGRDGTVLRALSPLKGES